MAHSATIGEYKLESFIEGNESVLFKATRPSCEAQLLAKIIPRWIAELKGISLPDFESPYIAKYQDIVQDETRTAIIMPFFEGGDLINWLSITCSKKRYYERRSRTREFMAVLMIYQIARGIHDLHSHGIIHGDIKLENVCAVAPFDKKLPILKLIDLESSISLGAEVTTSWRSYFGTPIYLPPEYLRQEQMSFSADIWALGIVAFFLFAGYHPFCFYTKSEFSRGNFRKSKIFSNVASNNINLSTSRFESLSDLAKSFLTSLLNPDAESRPRIADVLVHPIFAEYGVSEGLIKQIISNEICIDDLTKLATENNN